MSTRVFKLNPNVRAQWRAAMDELRAITKKDDPESVHKLVTDSAKRFVKNVAAVTPPASGALNSQAKAAGEQAILTDLLKLAVPVTITGSRKAASEVLAGAQDLLALHERARSGAQGRVNPRNRREKLFMENGTFNRVVAQLQKKVGWLAAGLNAAATKLGFSLPAWIKRHGAAFGSIEVQASDHGIRIRIIQNVPYADHVHDYERHWDFALLKEVTSLRGMVKAIYERKHAKARKHLAKH